LVKGILDFVKDFDPTGIAGIISAFIYERCIHYDDIVDPT